MDCEGAEVSILKGGTRYISTHRPTLEVEASPKLLCRSGSSLEEFVSVLSHAGYDAWSIGRFWLYRLRIPRVGAARN